MTNTKRIFLDLEETIITSWNDPTLMNVQRIKSFIDFHGVDEVDIFSFAIWNWDDVNKFNRDLRPMIETALGVQIVNVWSVEVVKRVVCHHMGGAVFSLSEFCSLWGKKRAFPDFVQAVATHVTDTTFKDQVRFILIDDCVPNMLIHNRDLALDIELVNVASL